ncbi:hypothetical protein SNE40_011141 [Patella caerulea]|uniref:Uncharacterized protein n=1 Tax=Patella caerulea TaxID=87958 RepID=A0AAN8JVR5_PATCE
MNLLQRKEEAIIRKLKSGINNTKEAKKNILAKREKLNENAKQRMDQVELNQEFKVKELREKSIKKAKHAKTVRLRKDINLDDLDPV